MTEREMQKIEQDLSDELTSYLIGWKDIRECATWLAGIDWSEIDAESPLGKTLGELYVICTEVEEGLRPEPDFRTKAAQFVSEVSCVTYSIAREETTVFSSSAAAAYVAPGLPFWSRSLQEAPS